MMDKYMAEGIVADLATRTETVYDLMRQNKALTAERDAARAEVERLKAERAADITPAQAYELRDILRTLTASGTALLTSARELVRLKEQAEAELDRRYPRETVEPQP